MSFTLSHFYAKILLSSRTSDKITVQQLILHLLLLTERKLYVMKALNTSERDWFRNTAV